MNEVSMLRDQVKQFVDEASEKKLAMVYHLLEAGKTNDWWDEIIPAYKEAIDEGIKLSTITSDEYV